MDKTEKSFKVFVECCLFIIIFLMFYLVGVMRLHSILISLLMSHTISWFLYSTVWAHLICSFEITEIDGNTFFEYTRDLSNRLTTNNSILCGAVFGSMSRGELHKHSDLDVRFVRREGFKNAISALLFTIKERLRAQGNGIPLEVLLGDSIEFMKRMRQDEPPIILSDPENLIKMNYKKYYLLDDAYKINRIKQ